MTLFPPVLADADVRHLPGWLSPAEADALQRALLATVAWEVHRIRMFGRLVDSPRLSSWIGDADARYRYSGTEFVPQPWPPLLGPLRQRLQHEFGARFNSVLANRYRDGRDSMGWHSDDEPELGAEPVIASLSLGSCRRFLLRRRRSRQAPAGTHGEPAIEYRLGHGDLLLMAGSTQRHYQHALPKMAAVAGERINLTFRWVRPSR